MRNACCFINDCVALVFFREKLVNGWYEIFGGNGCCLGNDCVTVGEGFPAELLGPQWISVRAGVVVTVVIVWLD